MIDNVCIAESLASRLKLVKPSDKLDASNASRKARSASALKSPRSTETNEEFVEKSTLNSARGLSSARMPRVPFGAVVVTIGPPLSEVIVAPPELYDVKVAGEAEKSITVAAKAGLAMNNEPAVSAIYL